MKLRVAQEEARKMQEDVREEVRKTQEELLFLAGLGTFSDCGVPARELLNRYERAMPLRANWDGIDRERVVAMIAGLREC